MIIRQLFPQFIVKIVDARCVEPSPCDTLGVHQCCRSVLGFLAVALAHLAVVVLFGVLGVLCTLAERSRLAYQLVVQGMVCLVRRAFSDLYRSAVVVLVVGQIDHILRIGLAWIVNRKFCARGTSFSGLGSSLVASFFAGFCMNEALSPGRPEGHGRFRWIHLRVCHSFPAGGGRDGLECTRTDTWHISPALDCSRTGSHISYCSGKVWEVFTTPYLLQ